MVRHRSDTGGEFRARRSGDTPGRSIYVECVHRRPAFPAARFRHGPLPVPAPFGEGLVTGISRPFEGFGDRCPGEGAVLRQPQAVNSRFRIGRSGPEQRRGILCHDDTARRLCPFAVTGPQRAFVEPYLGGKLRGGGESREKRYQKEDSFHGQRVLSSTRPAAPRHPARLPSTAATISVSPPQTSIACRRTPSRSFSR